MMDWLVGALLILGSGVMVLAAAGALRMPDLFLRMQATTMAVSFGVTTMFVAVAAHFRTVDVATRAAAGILFLFLTAPNALHLLARAAYAQGATLWDGTHHDDLRTERPPRPPHRDRAEE